MIGYYVHHVGQGHANRARAIADRLAVPVTVLSSLPRPADWRHDWIVLPRDDTGHTVENPSADGTLHWAPLHHSGLRHRMAALAAWIDDRRPRVLVSDVSVEVALQARLMGVPVIVVALPGTRTDPAHQLGYRIADAILAPWPRLSGTMCPGLTEHANKVRYVGGISRFDRRPPVARSDPAGRSRVGLWFRGAGGADRSPDPPTVAGWQWQVGGPGNWLDDPWPALCAADVVLSSCGLGVVSDIAAARRPAVLLPEARPHDEQASTARALAQARLGVVLEAEPPPGEWPGVLERAVRCGGSGWSRWSVGDGAARAAAVVTGIAEAA